MDATHAHAASRFADVITTESELREIVGRPNRLFTSKVMFRLDRACRQFIARSPFVIVASDGAGGLDLSPKGDPPGFVRVLDDATLAVPDRRGNRRLDTFCNVLHNPRVGLIFLVPGQRDTLRVAGQGLIVRDLELRTMLAEGGRVPELALIVSVERVFFHCGKCIKRSNLWAAN